MPLTQNPTRGQIAEAYGRTYVSDGIGWAPINSGQTVRYAPITMDVLSTLDAAAYPGVSYELIDAPGSPGDLIRSVGGRWLRVSDNSPVM